MRNSQQVPGQSSKIDSGEDMEEYEAASRFAPSTKKSLRFQKKMENQLTDPAEDDSD